MVDGEAPSFTGMCAASNAEDSGPCQLARPDFSEKSGVRGWWYEFEAGETGVVRAVGNLKAQVYG